MPADIRLDDGGDGWVSAEGPIFRVVGTDVMVDSVQRREGAAGPYRRALVHGPEDTLFVNWKHDYSGGVILNGARFEVLHFEDKPRLPKDGVKGQILATVVTHRPHGGPGTETVTLWLCIGVPPHATAVTGVHWVPLQTGSPVLGTT